MWAANQLQNSKATVGLHGNSYMGLTQAFTIAALGPNSPVKAAQASCMGAEFYRETYFAGGVPTQTLNFQRVIGVAMAGDTAAAGAANVADIEAGGPKAYYTEFWEQRTVGNLAQKMVDAGVPVLLWSTDGDIYAQSSLDLYAYLHNAYNKQPVYGPMPASSTPTGRRGPYVAADRVGYVAPRDVGSAVPGCNAEAPPQRRSRRREGTHPRGLAIDRFRTMAPILAAEELLQNPAVQPGDPPKESAKRSPELKLGANPR